MEEEAKLNVQPNDMTIDGDENQYRANPLEHLLKKKVAFKIQEMSKTQSLTVMHENLNHAPISLGNLET